MFQTLDQQVVIRLLTGMNNTEQVRDEVKYDNDSFLSSEIWQFLNRDFQKDLFVLDGLHHQEWMRYFHRWKED